MAPAHIPHIHLDLPMPAIAEFCKRWQIREFALFGSVLREDFRPDSDVDVLVTYMPTAHPSLFSLVQMEEELKKILGRDVDLVDRLSVESSENYIRRRNVLNSAIVICSAEELNVA